jgi:hypothetical protein
MLIKHLQLDLMMMMMFMLLVKKLDSMLMYQMLQLLEE